MNTKCKICGVTFPLTLSKTGQPVAGKKYCATCGKARTKVLGRLREDRKKLKRHYEHLETELKVIEKVKELIKIGEDTDTKTKEFLKTGKGYWEEYNLREFYHPEKIIEEDPYAKDKI